MMKGNYVIGIDFGTASARAILVNAKKGNKIASSVSAFKRWKKNLYCDPSQNQFRQHPLDYIESLEAVVTDCLDKVSPNIRNQLAGISVATTGSSPVAVNKQGLPLALLDDFKDNANAMFILWKDHTAIAEAEEINTAGENFTTNYLKYLGGNYSSEWYWAKLLHVLRTDSRVAQACHGWVEQSDWIPFYLTGGQNVAEIKRNVTAAGHKALWANEFNGLPPGDFFEKIDPQLLSYVKRFGQKVYTADQPAGGLSEKLASQWGLSPEVKIGIGSIDAHVGAVGGMIKPYYLSKVIGTSTCDMMVVPKKSMKDVFVSGISGQVEDSIIPGMVGLEAGQSAFGDIYSWFQDLLLWPLKNLAKPGKDNPQQGLIDKLSATILSELSQKAAELPLDEDLEFAIDWFNGRRTPEVNPNLKAMLGNLTLGTTAPRLYRALVEATCFGSKAIADSIEAQGIKIEGVNAIGGIASKSDLVVQMMADVLNRPVRVSPIEQTVALGAAMFAAVVAQIHPNVEQAMTTIGKTGETTVDPRTNYVEFYDHRYKKLYSNYGKMIEQYH